ETERKRLEAFARDQFRLIRDARQALLAEQRAIEQEQDKRREDLERRAVALENRTRDLQEREQRLTEKMEDALLERDSSVLNHGLRENHDEERAAGPRTALTQADAESLGLQVSELRVEIGHLEAQRDRTLAQLEKASALAQEHARQTADADRLQAER